MKKNYCIKEIEITHYYRPGETLDDLSLKKLHNQITKINKKSGANVVNKMLDISLSFDEVKSHFTNVIVALISKEDEPMAFVISPILSSLDKAILHSGLIVVYKNPGVDLISLLALGNLVIGYEKLGGYYTTNITSTPSIIESFSKMVPGTWPHPDAQLKKIPKGYKEVLQILKLDYMDKYFPDPEKLSINYKRFTLTSNSNEMGFVTDFHKISRSDNFKFMAFCHAWIDYKNEEDIIQVGEVDFLKFMRMHYLLWGLKRDLKKALLQTQQNANYEKVDKSERKSA